MSPRESRSARVSESWRRNADAWTALVRSNGIESRRLATDAAIVAAVLARSPHRLLDLGCGEGWLLRALAGRGIDAVGLDGTADLVAAAQSLGGGRFLHLSYEELIADPRRCGGGFDLAVANFALFEEDVLPLLRAITRALVPGGALLIQTVHPRGIGSPEADGWRREDFGDFDGASWAPMPWYFRTPDSWCSVLAASGFRVERLTAPCRPDDGRPLSLLIEASARPREISRRARRAAARAVRS